MKKEAFRAAFDADFEAGRSDLQTAAQVKLQKKTGEKSIEGYIFCKKIVALFSVINRINKKILINIYGFRSLSEKSNF